MISFKHLFFLVIVLECSNKIFGNKKAALRLPSGAEMPMIGLGTWQARNESELVDVLNAAYDLGYRHIDTAFAYQNEAIIGKVLKSWFDSGKAKREDIFITTKLPVEAVNENKIEELINKSLNNLGLEYVDLYLIHFPVCAKIGNGKLEGSLKTDHQAVWKKMEEQVASGRAKDIGLSNFNETQIKRLLESKPKIKPANLQIELHVFLQQKSLVKYCQDNGITVTAYSPLGSPGYNKLLEKLNQDPRKLPDVINNEVVKNIAKKHNKTGPQVALKFLLQRNIIVIPKSVKPSRVKENIDLFDFTLDSDDMQALNDLEIGEPARVVNWKLIPKLDENEEWPWSK